MSKIRVKQIEENELSLFVNEVVSGDVSTLSSDLSQLQTDFDTQSGEFVTLESEFATISSDISTTSGRLNALESTFASFDIDLSYFSGAIDDLNTATGVIQSDLSGALDSISALESGLSGVSGITDSYIYNYIHLADVKNSGVGGGTFSGGDWRTRDINTEISDSGSLCSISSNIITLETGLYSCFISCPALGVGSHMARLYNVSDSSVLLSGTMEYAGSFSSRSFVQGRFLISGTTGKLVSIQHLGANTVSGSGFSSGAGLNDSSLKNIYTIAEFSRIYV